MAQDRMSQLREFASRYTAAWCSQDAASVAAFFVPRGSLTINGGTPSVGRSAIPGAAQGFMTAFPDLKVYMDDLLEKQGKIAESLGYFDAAEYQRQVEHGVTNRVLRAAFPRRDAQPVDPHSKERWFFTNHTRQLVNDRTNYFGG